MVDKRGFFSTVCFDCFAAKIPAVEGMCQLVDIVCFVAAILALAKGWAASSHATFEPNPLLLLLRPVRSLGYRGWH